MRQVFLNRPWVHPEEPGPLIEIFKKHGHVRKLPKGYLFNHGGSSGEVSLVTRGLAFFSFPDNEDKDRVFAIIPPKRVVGDLDAITEFRINVIASTVRPTEVLTMTSTAYRQVIMKSPELLCLYAKNSIRKEETHMEGLMANFTLPLEARLIALLSAIINAYYPLKKDDWNPCPLMLTTFEIADVISSNRSTISTIYNQWMASGLAKKDGRRMVVHGKLFETEYDWRQYVTKARSA